MPRARHGGSARFEAVRLAKAYAAHQILETRIVAQEVIHRIDLDGRQEARALMVPGLQIRERLLPVLHPGIRFAMASPAFGRSPVRP